MHWLNQNGVATKSDLTYFLTSKGPRLMPAGGGGASIVETLSARIEELGGTIEYGVTAKELIQGDAERVVGVEAVDSSGQPRRFLARTVVLASGGFEGER